ncbi:PAS domain-containing protein [Pontibacter sp. JAM-7]|uniref:PAS domain-containing protein n=1 Tax=Pontibacter sp. JAM-7 TaxID=3366581 RepID=UPI003AF58562
MTKQRERMHKRPSLLSHLGLFTAATVILVFALHSVLQYSLQREAIIEQMTEATAEALNRLVINISPLVSAYAVNDYQKLLLTETGSKFHQALVVKDNLMAEITGQDEFVTGKLRLPDQSVVDYDPESLLHQTLLQTAFMQTSQPLVGEHGQSLGQIIIYNSDAQMKSQLSTALYSTLLISGLAALFLISMLLGLVSRILVEPVNQLAHHLGEQDNDGIPLSPLPDFRYQETSLLSATLNRMISLVSDSRLKLEREAERFENVLEATRVGIWEWNIQTGATYFNERWAEIIGYRLQELEPINIDTWLNLAHPDDLAESTAALERHFSGDAPYYEIEARMKHRAGHWVWVLDRGKVTSWTEDGKPLLMQGTHQDVTRRKQASQALTDSLSRYQRLSESSPSGVWQIDADGKFIYLSPRWMQISGYRRDKLGTDWAALIHPEDRPAVMKAWLTAQQTCAFFRAEFRFAEPEAMPVWVICLANPEMDMEGVVTGWIGTITDITALKRTASQLELASQQAEAANIAKSRFLATMSHELRTPLNGILGMAQLLQDNNLQPQQRADYARTIIHSGQSLLALLNDILDLSKVEAGKMQLEQGALLPAEIMEECQRLFLESAHDKGLTLNVFNQIPAQQAYLGDAHRLRQMLTNLVNNAIKFTRQGGVELSCAEVSRDENVAVLEFAVKDTGIGIPTEKQRNIFNPFIQADDSTTRLFGGSGLGLSIVSSLAELMQGEVGVESEENKGSRFWFRVQARLSDQTLPKSSGLDPVNIADQPLQGQVLIVEDVEVNRDIAAALLDRIGLQCQWVGNGRLAVQQITETDARFDLVLMDLHMPELDGIEATKAIRAWEQTNDLPAIPILAMTADVFPEEQRACYAAGMNNIITKPVMLQDLYSVLATWLPTAENASSATAMPADVVKCSPDELLPAIDLLIAQLEQGAFIALDSFATLKQMAEGYAAAEVLTETGKLVDAFRFEDALERLQTVRQLLLSEVDRA